MPAVEGTTKGEPTKSVGRGRGLLLLGAVLALGGAVLIAVELAEWSSENSWRRILGHAMSIFVGARMVFRNSRGRISD